MTIKARHYEETVKRLAKNQVVMDMALELTGAGTPKVINADGGPSYEFMMAANREFSKRGGEDNGSRHIGAIAEAIIHILERIK